jgi:PKD repeat protein
MNHPQDYEQAVSDVLGAVILIGVIATVLALAGVIAFSQPLPQQMPALNARIWNDTSYIYIKHDGGDSLQSGNLRILVDGSTPVFNLTTAPAMPWQTLSIGDTLQTPMISSNQFPTVQVVYTGYGSSAIVLASYGLAGTSYVTIIPTTTSPTPTTTTPPLPPAPVTAGFTGSPTSGIRPLAVQFTDASTGPVTSRSWTFGDGNTSTVQSPLYTYPNAGTYSVSLTVSNGTGTNTLTRTNYITANLPPAQTIFSDNFESAFSGWTTSGTTNWYTGSPKYGTRSIEFQNNGQISRTVSTSGYNTISVSFALAGNSLEGAEAVQGQWSPDGISWNTMGEITNGVLEDNTLHNFTFSVPAGGNNNPTFAIRFRLIGTGNDRGYVDNIVVTGIPL